MRFLYLVYWKCKILQRKWFHTDGRFFQWVGKITDLRLEYEGMSQIKSDVYQYTFHNTRNADASKCFKWRKRGANKTYWWVISRKCLQDKCQKYSFTGEDCKANCAKTSKFVHSVKSMTTSKFECKFVLRIRFIANAYCSMSSVGLIHYNWHDEMFRYKSNRHHLVGLLTSSATLGIQRSFAFYALMLSRKKLHFQLGRFSRVFSKLLRHITASLQVRGKPRDRWIVMLYQKRFYLGKIRSATTDYVTWKATVQWMSVIA